MPRPKRCRVSSKNNIAKRWCTDGKQTPSSEVSQTLSDSLRLRNLETVNLVTEADDVTKVPKYVLVDMNNITGMFENVLCSSCYTSSLRVACENRNGFSQTLKLTCDICNCNNSVHTSKKVEEQGGQNKAFDVNMRVVQAFLSFGRGYSALENFCIYMNMPVMSSRTFNFCKRKLLVATTNSTNQQLKDIKTKVLAAYGVPESDIANISVSYDGTWLTRGHTSQIGVGCVIDLLTGYVVDFEVISKRCTECEQSKAALGEDSVEYDIWFQGHQSSCSITHTGSSGAMEVKAALKLWQRSEEKGFRYTTMLSDGDSKAYQELCAKKVYGDNIEIQKEECINHVGKRLGTALRNTLKEWRTKGVTLEGKNMEASKKIP